MFVELNCCPCVLDIFFLLFDPCLMQTCLQVVSVRDIYRSIIDASFKNPQQHRLLRFVLTDGISEAVAIEFFPIPFIIEDIAPGTKVSPPCS